MTEQARADAAQECCRAVLTRADGTLVSDELVAGSAASLRHLDQVRWRLPDGEYVLRIEGITADAST